MPKETDELEVKLSVLRMGIMEHYGNSDSFLYEFSVAVENEMEDMKPSQCDDFIKLAKAKGYIEFGFFESLTLETSDDGECFWWSHG